VQLADRIAGLSPPINHTSFHNEGNMLRHAYVLQWISWYRDHISPPVTGMGVAGSVIRIEGGLPENSDSIPGRPADDNASVAAHSSGSAAEASDHIADSSKPCSGAFDSAIGIPL
jgi:hypothetical protein